MDTEFADIKAKLRRWRSLREEVEEIAKQFADQHVGKTTEEVSTMLEIHPGDELVGRIRNFQSQFYTFSCMERRTLVVMVDPIKGDPDLRVCTQGPPTRDEYTWKSAGIGTDVVRIEPSDPNFIKGRYFVGVFSSDGDCKFKLSLTVENNAKKHHRPMTKSDTPRLGGTTSGALSNAATTVAAVSHGAHVAPHAVHPPTKKFEVLRKMPAHSFVFELQNMDLRTVDSVGGEKVGALHEKNDAVALTSRHAQPIAQRSALPARQTARPPHTARAYPSAAAADSRSGTTAEPQLLKLGLPPHFLKALKAAFALSTVSTLDRDLSAIAQRQTPAPLRGIEVSANVALLTCTLWLITGVL
jgi:hypothetical protein